MSATLINPRLFPPIPTPSIGEHIDSGFYALTTNQALQLAKASPLGRLPREGYCTTVTLDGHAWELLRTWRHVNAKGEWESKLVWSIHHYESQCKPCQKWHADRRSH